MIIIGGTVGIGGCYLSSLTKSWTIFRYLFPMTYGIMIGFTFMVHLYLSWKYIPGYEGIMTGIINTGFAVGGCIFTYTSSMILNPDSVNPIKQTVDNPNAKPFGPEIANRVPGML